MPLLRVVLHVCAVILVRRLSRRYTLWCREVPELTILGTFSNHPLYPTQS